MLVSVQAMKYVDYRVRGRLMSIITDYGDHLHKQESVFKFQMTTYISIWYLTHLFYAYASIAGICIFHFAI
jgi:hypothetical protein